ASHSQVQTSTPSSFTEVHVPLTHESVQMPSGVPTQKVLSMSPWIRPTNSESGATQRYPVRVHSASDAQAWRHCPYVPKDMKMSRSAWFIRPSTATPSASVSMETFSRGKKHVPPGPQSESSAHVGTVEQ